MAASNKQDIIQFESSLAFNGSVELIYVYGLHLYPQLLEPSMA